MLKLYNDETLVPAEKDYDAYIYGGLSTGSLGLDMAIGRPGIPMGRLTEIAAEDDSGKTALALELVYQAQKRGMLVIINDTERTYEEFRLADRGIDKEGLIFMRTDFLEDTFERIEKIIDSLHQDEEALIIIDSIAGIATKAEFGSDYDDFNVGTHAAVLAKGFRKLIPRIAQNSPSEKNKKKVALVVINQLKENVKLSRYQGGSNARLKHFGGYAPKYHASLRIVLEKEEIIFDKSKEAKDRKPIGIRINAHLLKNKIAVPYRDTEFILNFAKGIDIFDDLFNVCQRMGFMYNKGSFYYCKLLNGTKGFHRKDWPNLVLKYGGAGRLRKYLREKAFEKNIMRPYGIVYIPTPEELGEANDGREKEE